jgi:TatD DNase family protein
VSFIDSHCHLDDEQFDNDRDDVVRRALDAGVEVMLAIGTGDGPPDLDAALRLAEQHDAIFATVGVHPQHAAQVSTATYEDLRERLRHPKCVGIGEIGLDYYWKPFDKQQQLSVFTAQLRIAADAGIPVSIHTRDAWQDTIAILREHWAPTRLPCVLHCFTGGPEQAAEALDMGFYLSFAGVVSYPKATEVHAAAKVVPGDRILAETDSPYLAPMPYRGKRNEPAFVTHTTARLAELRAEPIADVAASIKANFRRVFFSRGNVPPEPTRRISYTR